MSVLPDADAPLATTLRVLAERERLQRRRLLGWLGGAAAAGLMPARSMACVLIPSETGGPYPGDGSNGPNALTQSGIVRSDIRASFGASGSTLAGGTLLTVTLRLVSSTGGCAPLAGLAVYLWHCNAAGGYSMYSSGITAQNYLRGVQVSHASGEIHFTTIFPGCYPGRWPHMHFEVFASLAAATSGSNALRTSQLALPETACRAVYAQAALYPAATSNLNQLSLASDNVFGDDGGIHQLATVAGDNQVGYAALLEVGVPVEPAAAQRVFANGFEG